MMEDNTPEDDLDFGDDRPSKSQKKRDMQSMRDMGARLVEFPDEHLLTIPYPDIISAVQACRKITKGNARKRQIQYIGKLISKLDPEPVRQLIDRFDASSQAHVLHFHKLEQWRERLISEDPDVMSEIITGIPDIDRQHLRQLVRHAIQEREQDTGSPVHFRKLFQYLKSFEFN
ncbi:MAG: DUF615 domain-containing protein [Pseudomonadales bacterium]|nr:DUF615 domain-containing protein [Pseudomonadales bacterium]